MKKWIGKLLFAALSGLLVFLIGGIFIKKAKAEQAAERIKRLPDLALTDISGDTFRTDQIHSGPLLITFFHPECDHCRYEILSFIGSGLLNEHLTVLFFSHADEGEVESFMQELGVPDTPNLHIFHDHDFGLSRLFGADIMPSNFLYNDSLQLVKVFKGSTRPEAILKYLYGHD
ncbi:MAG: thioredoxin family protein [Bacteroidales bacterium]